MAARYLEALQLVNLSDLARETGRGYRTLTSYRSGERRVTAAAAHELLMYLVRRATALTAAATTLRAALAEEGIDNG